MDTKIEAEWVALLLEYKHFDEVAVLVNHTADVLSLHSRLIKTACDHISGQARPSKKLSQLANSAQKYIAQHEVFMRYIAETLDILEDSSQSLDNAITEALDLRAKLKEDLKLINLPE